MLRAGPQGKSRRASSLAGASPFNRIFTLRALLVAAALSAGVIYLLIKQVPSQFPQVSASDVHHPQSSSSEAGRQTSSEHTSHTEQHHTRTSPMATSTVADRSSSHAAGYNAAPVGRVVVVGGGLAGLAAALTAAGDASRPTPGFEVVLIEKMPKLGGNSMKASSGINALNPGGPLLFERPSLWDGERGVQVPERSMGAWARLCGAERRCLMTHEA